VIFSFTIKDWLPRLPLLLTFLLVTLGGFYLLNHSSAQNRDTIRKHHLQDLEQALYLARDTHGTYPPYEESQWCGELNASPHASLRQQVETALRTQNKQYANAAKPFPTDPLATQGFDYFYWKHSPTSFELYSILETDATGEKNSFSCSSTSPYTYDYGLTSVQRPRG
jgi:hypothetical protein